MKKKILIAGVTVIVMCLAAGCQEKAEEIPPLAVETIRVNEETDNTKSAAENTKDIPSNPTEETPKDPVEDSKDPVKDSKDPVEDSKDPAKDSKDLAEDPKDAVEDPAGETSAQEELEGDVTDIGENKLTVNKTFVEGNTAVSIVGEGAVMIAVYVSDKTVYEFQEVRNGGINESDITSREGSFSDIQIGSSLRMTGSWKGEDFYPDKVIIYKFYH